MIEKRKPPHIEATEKLRRIADYLNAIADELESGRFELRHDSIGGGISRLRDSVKYMGFDEAGIFPTPDAVDIEFSGRQEWGKKRGSA